MELRHLRYFIAVAEERNVTRAAVRLRLAQPALSRQIRDLENELGVALFDREARSIHLNPAGRHFLEEARETVARFEQAVHSVRDFASVRGQEFHLGYAPSLTTHILPNALREFKQAYPLMLVKLHDLSTEEMLTGLREKQLNAALLVRPSDFTLDGLTYTEMTRFRPCVVMPRSHPLADSQTLTVQSLADERLIAYNLSSYPEHRAWLRQVFKATQIPRIVAECDGFSSLIAAVEFGDGIAVVHEGFEAHTGDRLAIRPLKAPDSACFSFGVVRRKGDTSKTTKSFIQAVLTASPAVPDTSKTPAPRPKRRQGSR